MTQLTSSDKSKDIQCSKDYVRIQQNSEFLTNIKRKIWKQRSGIPYNIQMFSKQTQNNSKPQLIDPTSFARACTQVAYLLYTCYIKQKNIFLGKKLLLWKRFHNSYYEVYLQYILASQVSQLFNEKYSEQNRTQKQQSAHYIQKNMFECVLKKSSSTYSQIVVKKVQQILKAGLQYIQKYKTVLINHQSLKGTYDNLYKMMQNLNKIVIQKYLKPRISQLGNPRITIQCLQQSKLFRQYALILKVFNSSIYSSIISNSMIKNQLKNAKRQENKYIEAFKSSNNKAKQFQNVFFNIINNFLLKLVQEKILSSGNTMDNTKQTGSSNINGFKVCQKVDSQNSYDLIGKFDVVQRQNGQFNQQLFDKIRKRNTPTSSFSSEMQINQEQESQKMKQGASPGKNSYEYEYMVSKNLINVRYITDIQLSIENTDIIMYQCNNIPFDLNSVTLELIDRNQAKQATKANNQNVQKKRDKVVAFKTISHFDSRQEPLTKILLLLDLVMISAKIFTPQLTKTKISLDQYWKVQDLAKKANHLISLFMRKVNKTYTELNQ